MSLYEKVPTSVNFVEREKQTEKFWHDNDIFQEYGAEKGRQDLHIL